MTGKIFSFLCFVILLLSGCSKSDDQRQFENEALHTPEGITETDNQGNTINEDPGDWRIAPMYSGLVSIGTPDDQPPYPNPLSFNQSLTINIYIRSIETLNRIEVYAFEFPEQAYANLIAIRDDVSSPTLETIIISGESISGFSGGSETDVFRILISDGNQNLISYGDIEVE